MTADPVASIVVPSYNHARFVGGAVESALGQSVRDLEVVIVDDGSSDGSPSILRRLADDPRVRLIEQENRGAHAAIARGLELARGQYVFVLNSDDLYPPTRVERALSEFALSPDIVAVCSWIDVIDDAGATIGVKEAWRTLPPWPRPERGAHLDDLEDPKLSLLAGNFVATTSNLAFRREAARRVELEPLRYCHDWDLVLQLARLGDLAVIEQPLVRYRVHGANTLREGRDADQGEANMRFEILWVVARHATAILSESVAAGRSERDLVARFWRSIPRFGRLGLASWLVALAQEIPDPAFRELLEPAHPVRRRAVAALREG